MSFDNIAIRVEAVSKRFELYEHPRDQLKQFVLPRLQRLVKRSPQQYFKEFWALRDISFAIQKGESCGIVGLNGSGKSTLLQIITGTLSPTLGQVSTHGRIAALLELGSGFSMEFTGRENVYMNGALLGFNRQQVDAKVDEIQVFADIGKHFDQSLKTYSSGMQMRVAFAVATAFEPDILIIDEALAVGDGYFQQKCFHRLEQFSNNGGTLLFVSHDANTVKHLCSRAVLLSDGALISLGDPRDVIDLYQGMIAQKTDMGERPVEIRQTNKNDAKSSESAHGATSMWTKATTITANGDAELIDFRFLDSEGHRIWHIVSERELQVQYRVRLNKDFERPAFGLIIRDRMGRSLFETSTFAMRIVETPVQSNKMVIVTFRLAFSLRAGQYSFSIGVANKGFSRSEFEEYSLLMHDVEQILVLEAEDSNFYGGVFNMRPTASINILD